MKPGLSYRNRLSSKILLVFMLLSLLPILLFGVKFVNITSFHMEKDVKVWEKLQPEYVQQAREFHDKMKARLHQEVISYALYSTFIAIFISLIASGVIIRPLRRLMEGSKQLGDGNLDYRLEVKGGDEISQLAAAFNTMAASLKERNEELLRKERYIEKMLDPMWILDNGNRVFDVNPAFTKLFGYDRNDIIGSYAGNFFDNDNQTVFETHIREKNERGLADVYEISIRCSKGENVPVLVSCSPITENGRVIGKIGVFKDISARKELEEDIVRKNKELYALNTISTITSQSMKLEEILTNTVKEVLVIIGMDAGGIYITDEENREIRCVTHVGVPERFVQQMQRFRYGEDIPGLVAITGEAVAIPNISQDPRIIRQAVKESSMKGYICLPLKSKERVRGILCMLSSKEHVFTQGELEFLESVGHIVGVAIENIKLYEREKSRLSGLVSLEKNRAEAILSSIAEAVYTVNNEFYITYWNRSAEAITGFKAADVVGRKCSDVLMHENEYGERLCDKGCLMKKQPSPLTGAQTAFCAIYSGKRLPTVLTSASIRDAGGEEIGRVTVFRDITREMEIDRMKTDFVRTVSHELRTPLSAIVGMTEMLLDGEVKNDEAALEYLETIHTEGQRLASMVEELLDIAKIESGRQEFRKEAVSVQPMIERCINILSSQATAKNITIHWDGSGQLPPIRADREKFHQVVFNLLNNSLCYSDTGAQVRIAADVQNGYLALSLEDTGWGIPEQDLPHIFKKFYRSKAHAHSVKGSGLGLPLVLEIVKAHEGKIDVESAPGKGSRFTVKIPVAKR